MAYVGGKARTARFIINVLNDPTFDGLPYFEPFIGYAHIFHQVKNKASYHGSDYNKDLVALHHHLQTGGDCFPHITREEYHALKNGTYPIPSQDAEYSLATLRAFAAFPYSYSGKEFGGYAVQDKAGTRNYLEETFRYFRKLKQKTVYMANGIQKADYAAIPVLSTSQSIVYCDPPYSPIHSNQVYYDTGSGSSFDHMRFWATMRQWALAGHWVFVSEYSAPTDFIALRSWCTTSSLAAQDKTKRTEHLFIHESQYDALRFIEFKGWDNKAALVNQSYITI